MGDSPVSNADPSGLLADDAPDADIEAEIQHVQAGYDQFWCGVNQVGNALHTGIETLAALNPVTSFGIGLNKAGEGKYAQAALFFLPAVSALGGEGGAAAEAELASEGAGSARSTLYHYTSEEGYHGILESNQLNPSLNPRFAHFGPGQYLTDIAPGSMSTAALGQAVFRSGRVSHKLTHFVEIDVTGLTVAGGRENVFVVPGEAPLGLVGRIVSHGPTPR